MNSSRLDSATDDFLAGRFKAALQKLRSLNIVSSPDAGAYSVLMAEVYQVTGANTEAHELASALLTTPARLSLSEASRCYGVLGSAALELGDAEDGAVSLRRSLQVAADADDLLQLCNAQLKLLRFLTETSPLETVYALMSEARKSVQRLGEGSLFAYLHLIACQAEAKRGSVHQGARHAAAAEALLNHEDNLWLRGILALHRCGLAFLVSGLADAEGHAGDALASAQLSGHAATHSAAIVNLATLKLLGGRIADAQRYIRLAERLPVGTKVTNVALLHAKAEIAFVQERWTDCGRFLVEAHDSYIDTTWTGFWIDETRIRYLQRLGRWTESIELAAEAVTKMDAISDHFHSAICRLLMADAFIALGQPERGSLVIGDVSRLWETLPIEVLGETARVRAKVLNVQKMGGAARAEFERALRFGSASGSVLLRGRVADDYAFAVADSFDASSTARQNTGWRSNVTSPPRPKRVCFFPDNSSNLLGSDARLSAELPILPNLSAAIDVASNAELFAQEAFVLLYDARCTAGLALITKGKRRRTEILAVSGWGYKKARELAAKKDPPGVIHLGSARGRDFMLLVEPLDELEAAEKVTAIRKLLHAAIALEKARQDEKDRAALWPEEPIGETADGVFVSGQTLEILSIARRVAPTELPVLLTGESGTGKEVLARAIHRASNRATGPFLAFNCTAVPKDMVDSQLFGHRRGAFTGAHEAFSGVIRGASGGTLFLDEIGELGLDVQPKLLRFLETHEIHPLGEPHPIPVDVRVLAATNRDLDHLVATGGFREDLFYRLNVIRLRVPPLRERREEIPPLIQYFLARFSKELRRPSIRLPDETLEYLLLYGWPGNVRQLSNELRRAVATLGPDGVIHPQLLSTEIRASRKTVPAGDSTPPPQHLLVRTDQPLPAAVAFLERVMVSKALDASDGNVEDAAEALGISRKGLYLKRQRLRLGP